MATNLIDTVQNNQLKETLEKSAAQYFVVDFWAPWCGPCRQLAPILEALATQLDEKTQIIKVNIDDNRLLVVNHAIKSIPTILIMDKKGNEIDRLVGPEDANAILNKIPSH